MDEHTYPLTPPLPLPTETTFGNSEANLQLGVNAKVVGSFQDIGFGFVGASLQHKPPGVIAFEQTNGSGETSGDLVFGTRTTTAGSTGASEQIRIRSDGTVDVESVRFTGAQMGINGSPTILTFSAGAVAVQGTMDVSSNFSVGTDEFVVTASSGKATTKGAIEMTMDTATISHTGSGGLTISSTIGAVAVESVQFAGANIGVSGDTNLLQLASAVVTVDGKVASTTLETSGAATVGSTLAVGGAHADATKELYVNGNIYATGTSTSASDVRFKQNVTSIVDALDTVRLLRPVTFSFKTNEYEEKGYKFPKNAQFGVVAQELEIVLPDLVTADDKGYKGVAYERLGVYALAAVKELDKEVKALRAALQALRRSVENID